MLPHFFLFVLFSRFFCHPNLGEMDDKMDDEKSGKLGGKNHCTICDYTCKWESDLNKHFLTAKHKRMTNDDEKSGKLGNALFVCDCGKEYKYRQGLHKHQKKCKSLNDEKEKEKEDEKEDEKEKEEEDEKESPDYKDLLMQAMKQMQKKDDLISESQQQIRDMIPLIGNNNNNTTNNTTNNFNLNFFLNETCKDALNITDFINSLQLQLEDLEYTAENGHIKGITNIFQTALSNMEENKRPMHCTDLKREVLYIKENDEWSKDDEKDKIKETINQITNKNIKNVNEWLEKYPGHLNPDSKDFDRYMKMTSNCMGTGEETDNNKIVKNILKEVIIEK